MEASRWWIVTVPFDGEYLAGIATAHNGLWILDAGGQWISASDDTWQGSSGDYWFFDDPTDAYNEADERWFDLSALHD